MFPSLETDRNRAKALCLTCGRLQTLGEYCSRCEAPLHQRKPHSLPLTWGLAISALILLLPANLLPIMIIEKFGSKDGDTIIEGVIYFLRHKEYFVAIVIFVASIVIPFIKLLILFAALLVQRLKLRALIPAIAKALRFVRFIGKYSMLDVFVVGLMVAMVHFGQMASVLPAPAVVPFAAAVILTMIATETFDTRLLWDIYDDKHH